MDASSTAALRTVSSLYQRQGPGALALVLAKSTPSEPESTAGPFDRVVKSSAPRSTAARPGDEQDDRHELCEKAVSRGR